MAFACCVEIFLLSACVLVDSLARLQKHCRAVRSGLLASGLLRSFSFVRECPRFVFVSVFLVLLVALGLGVVVALVAAAVLVPF